MATDPAEITDNQRLFSACYKGNIEETRRLLAPNKTQVNAKTDGGFTPLHLALAYGYSDLANYLIANGADQSAETMRGDTPAQYAKNMHRFLNTPPNEQSEKMMAKTDAPQPLL